MAPCGKQVHADGCNLCWGSGIDDEDAINFIYNNGNNASTDNITAGVAA